VAVVDLAYNLFTINDKYVEAMQEKLAFLLMLGNSTLNSLVYFWQNKALRVQAKTFITKTAICLNCNLNIFSNYTPAQILKSDQLGPLNPITLVCGRSEWVAYNAQLGMFNMLCYCLLILE
jgi:hypothetical protein